MTESGSHDWWKHTNTLMGLDRNINTDMQGVANKTVNGDCGLLANRMNEP